MSDSWGHVAAKLVTTTALLGLSYASVFMLYRWSMKAQRPDALVNSGRVEKVLQRLAMTSSDFNEYELVLLADVIFADEAATTFADVGGLERVKQGLREAVVDPMHDPTRFRSLLLTAPKGVLLYGPAGCGKTMLARAVAGECRCAFINVKSSSLFFK